MTIDNLLDIFTDETRASIQVLNTVLLELEKFPRDVDALNEVFRNVHTIKSMAETVGLKEISSLANNMENLLEYLRCHKKTVSKDDLDLLFSCSDKLGELVDKIVKTGSDQGCEGVNDLIKNIQNINLDISNPNSINPIGASGASGKIIRVNENEIDKLINLIGELVIAKTKVSQLSRQVNNDELSTVTASLENITQELQAIVMKMKLIPVEQVFKRFPRLVRDFSTELGKEIKLSFEGEEVEIDRAMVEEISESLVHIIKNSADHGVEAPLERIQAGKSPRASIKLVALNDCSNLLIKVIDDGRGIDTGKVAQKALEKGLVTKEKLDALSKPEILEFIFSPGFSLAEKITGHSGRGVGMDAVKAKINSLNGTISIHSEKGAGTAVTIVLPADTVIIHSLIVKCANEVYAIPYNYVEDVIYIPAKDLQFRQNKQVIRAKGQTIPVKRLEELLNLPYDRDSRNDNINLILIKNKMIGISVSEIIGQQEIGIKNVNKSLYFNENYIAGATTLGDNQSATILNINALIK